MAGSQSKIYNYKTEHIVLPFKTHSALCMSNYPGCLRLKVIPSKRGLFVPTKAAFDHDSVITL